MRTSQRNDNDELQKVIMKKQNKYEDEQKLIQYLMRQGFRYDDIRDATQSTSD
jgi:regulatory protein